MLLSSHGQSYLSRSPGLKQLILTILIGLLDKAVILSLDSVS